MEIIRLRGIGVSPGIAMGRVLLSERLIFTGRKESISTLQVDRELRRLRRAIAKTNDELIRLKGEIKKKLGDENAFIFEVHLLILQDKALLANLERIIREERVKAEWALSQVNNKYARVFEAINDEYFRQRKSDVSDVLAKIYRNLASKKEIKEAVAAEKILVAHELLPSEAASRLSQGTVLGVAMDVGGQTSHTAILARSLNIPAVVGLHNITQLVKSGDYLIVDGTDGEVMVNPPKAVRKEFAGKREKYNNYRKELQKTAALASTTLDGEKFFPLANIELPDEVSLAFSYGAEGIGLFRSEFLYLQASLLPSEDDHFEVYSRLAREASPAPVYIRTIDIGGEKSLPQLNIEREPNPALGMRAIRFSLRNKELFMTQLRAILRASSLGNLRILIPMVTEFEEVLEVKHLFEEVKQGLRERRVKFDERIPLGIMIEVPAAAAVADMLVEEVDYLSIGTNDLIQYYLAVDRSNEFVSYLYKPLHPSVLKLIRFIIRAARKAGKDVSVCGEMAADPLSAVFLFGLGLRIFSMNPIFIPKIKKALRSIDTEVVEKVVQEALKLKTAQEIEEYVIEKILVKYPGVFLMGQG